MEKQKIINSALTAATCLGVVGTGIISSKNAISMYNDEIEYIRLTNNEPTKKQKAKLFFKKYWPTLTIGGLTITSAVTNSIVNDKMYASLALAFTALAGNYQKLKSHVPDDVLKEVYKKVSGEEIKPKFSIKEGESLYYIDDFGYFKANPEKFLMAMIKANRGMGDYSNGAHYSDGDGWAYDMGSVTLYQILKWANATDMSKDMIELAKQFGWNDDYLMSAYCISSIDFNIDEEISDDGFVYKHVSFIQPAIYNPGLFDPSEYKLYNPTLSELRKNYINEETTNE